MSDLFSQPFEEDPQDRRSARSTIPRPTIRRPANSSDAESPAPESQRPRAPRLHGLGADRGDPRHARVRVRRRLGRGRDLELPRVEHRTSLLHAEGRRGADQGRDVPLGRPLPQVQARGRPARRRARTPRRLRAEGRIPARLRAPPAARAWRAAAGVRAAEEEAPGGGAVRRSRASARCRRCREDRHRHVARRRGAARHHQGAEPAPSQRPPRDPAGARAGRRRRRGSR